MPCQSSEFEPSLSYSFDGKPIFISGECGSLGSAIVLRLLNKNTLVVFDNNQTKLTEMERRLADDRLRCFLGDVRDQYRLRRGLEECNGAFHCAALKSPVANATPWKQSKPMFLDLRTLLKPVLTRFQRLLWG